MGGDTPSTAPALLVAASIRLPRWQYRREPISKQSRDVAKCDCNARTMSMRTARRQVRSGSPTGWPERAWPNDQLVPGAPSPCHGRQTSVTHRWSCRQFDLTLVQARGSVSLSRAANGCSLTPRVLAEDTSSNCGDEPHRLVGGSPLEPRRRMFFAAHQSHRQEHASFAFVSYSHDDEATTASPSSPSTSPRSSCRPVCACV